MVALSVITCSALGAATLLVTGSWKFPFVWTVFIVEAAVAILCIYQLDPTLLNERMRPQGKDQDKLGSLTVGVLYILSILIPALDIGRLHVSDNIPVFMQIVGTLMNIAGWAGVFWAMRTNLYFSSAVRLQEDRNQQVITTGPYRIMRHPGYSFASLGFLGQTFMMGSWLGFLPTFLLIVDFIYRSFLEERILFDGLPGYKAYMARVKSRWIPGIL